ncbi:hypothetical protein SAMN06265222_101818 [Neorhodopirellula lusitana]|uniref:Secreted protein n=1 Tax=Neorhodopirellula lusitana TaxID=445327 RepID=A0ABY1PQI1_9BACT|nr:hypothetical protein SAMN06265222_101818 [Neorhodopirellula lusitana]
MSSESLWLPFVLVASFPLGVGNGVDVCNAVETAFGTELRLINPGGNADLDEVRINLASVAGNRLGCPIRGTRNYPIVLLRNKKYLRIMGTTKPQ